MNLVRVKLGPPNVTQTTPVAHPFQFCYIKLRTGQEVAASCPALTTGKEKVFQWLKSAIPNPPSRRKGPSRLRQGFTGYGAASGPAAGRVGAAGRFCEA